MTRPPQHDTLHRLLLMRGIALAAQLLVVAVAQILLQIRLPLAPILTAILLLAAFNGWTWWRCRQARPAGDALLFIQLLVDIVVLSALFYYTGGFTNPFVSFYLPALAVAAAILPWRFAATLALLALGCYSLLMFSYVPLEMGNPDMAINYHLLGMWANFVVSAVLITWFVARMSGAVRQRDAQLAQARERALHSRRLAALGTQAAAAAHELGTPLATVALIAGDLRAEAAGNPALAAWRDDLALVESQIALCKGALGRMNRAPQEGPQNLRAALGQVLDNWRLRHPQARLQLALDDTAHNTVHADAIGQIMLTLLDNAAQAGAGAAPAIDVALHVDAAGVRIEVADDGPGMPAELIAYAGHEPLPGTADGLGIGLLLAFAMAREIGATLNLQPRAPRGLLATLSFPLQ